MATSLSTGAEARFAARNNTHTTSTSGLAPTYVQANLIILPSKYAADFRRLCARNPVPCPLIAESAATGRWDAVKSHLPGIEGEQIVSNCDIRRDAPGYMVYKDSELVKTACQDIVEEWTNDHVAFLIGCSYSFESELIANSLPPRHTVLDRNVPMYRTNIPLCSSGVFKTSTYVVSMRPYNIKDIEKVREITRQYSSTHGEPVAWGWDAVKRLGIKDIDSPEWGASPFTIDGKPFGTLEGSEDEVPVFWGCGVTPQEAVMRANLSGTVMAHSPGLMLVLDIRDSDILKKSGPE